MYHGRINKLVERKFVWGAGGCATTSTVAGTECLRFQNVSREEII